MSEASSDTSIDRAGVLLLVFVKIRLMYHPECIAKRLLNTTSGAALDTTSIQECKLITLGFPFRYL